jgi:16S rRNA (cytidine1402-2'-O)-methyltransferase
MTMAGCIYLLPVTLGDDNYHKVIPADVIKLTCSLRYFIVENVRSARRYLRMIDNTFPIDDSIFYELNEHTRNNDLDEYLEPVMKGYEIGLMSEAGMPGIADPGSRIVQLAQSRNIRVVPLAGPSSILLALIASGLNGQNFAFNGYLPVKPNETSAKLKELEKRSQTGQTQIFMETPYRNQKLFESILNVCSGGTLLCIATDLSLPTESIKTMRLSEWAKLKPVLNKRPSIFLLQA